MIILLPHLMMYMTYRCWLAAMEYPALVHGVPLQASPLPVDRKEGAEILQFPASFFEHLHKEAISATLEKIKGGV